MKRLEEIQLPEWTRIMWGSLEIRNEWEPKIATYKKAFESLELDSVKKGHRKAALSFYSPLDLADKTIELVKEGLTLLPVAKVKSFNSTYSSSVLPVEPEDTDILLRCLICKVEDAEEVRLASEAGDYELGEMLGYPECCRKFFKDVWVTQGFRDTSWKMVDDGDEASIKELKDIDPRNNILWRWMGVRAFSHLPCSFDCKETAQIGEKNLSLLSSEAKDIGLEILSWPIEWSALHGVAEIKTPILKVSTRTDVTPITYTIRLKSDKYPEKGISGVNFPFKNSSTSSYTQKLSFRSVEFEAKDWYYKDNFFGSLDAMNTCHKPLLSILRRNMSKYKNILDLGCGNGALLYKLTRLQNRIVPFGCDINETAIKHSNIIHSDFYNNFQFMDIAAYVKLLNSTPGVMFDLCLLTPARIKEYDENGKSEDAEALRYFIKNKCKYVLLYSYGDNLAPTETGGVPWEAPRIEAAEGTFRVAKLDGYQIIDSQDNSNPETQEQSSMDLKRESNQGVTTATLVKFNTEEDI